MDDIDGVEQAGNKTEQARNNMEQARNTTEQDRNNLQQGWNTEKDRNNMQQGWDSMEQGWNPEEGWNRTEPTQQGVEQMNRTEQSRNNDDRCKEMEQNKIKRRNDTEQWNQARDGRNSEENDKDAPHDTEPLNNYTKVTHEIVNNNINETEILLDGKIISSETSMEDEDSCSIPDGGYGWCVVLVGTICAMVVTTQGPCFGVLYGAQLDELGATPGLGSWLFNFHALMWNLMGPWTGPLSEVFSYRQLGVFGALLVAASIFLSAFVTSPYLYFITFSIFTGIGGGISIMSCFYILPQYFHRRLGLANGFMVAGGSLGIMTLPQFASFLQERYPFKAAAFITGAVMLNVPVLLLLLHPVSWHNKSQQKTPTSLSSSTPSLTAQDKTPISSLEKHKHHLLDLPRGSSVPEKLLNLNGGLPEESLLYTPKRIRRDSECQYLPPNRIRAESECQYISRRRISTRSECRHELEVPEMYSHRSSVLRQAESTPMGGSMLMGSIFAIDQQKQVDSDSIESLEAGVEEGTKTMCTSRWVLVWRSFRAQYNLSLIKDPFAAGLALASCVTITASVNIFATIPFLLRESGYSLSEAATALSVTAVVDLVTRLLASPLTDLPGLDCRVIYGVGQLIFIIVPFVLINGLGSWWLVMGCMVMFGIGLGIVLVLDVLLVIKVLGRERLSSVFGLGQFFRCIFFSLLGPIGGELRKATGDFSATIIFFSCVVALGLAFLLATSIYHKCDLRNNDTKAKQCDGSVG